MPRRPALRYHGGKWLLAPWIISHLPPHRIYTEVYGGGASILLRKPRSYAEIYNDLDGEVVNLFRVLRDQGDALVSRVQLTPFSRDEFELGYAPSDDPIEQARRTLARSFMGFGSASASGRQTGFRANSNRSGSTPAHDWANLPESLTAVVQRLAGVVIENRDALSILTQQDSTEAVHVVDPPYVHSTRKTLDKAYRHEMSDDDHRVMATALKSLRGKVVLCGYPSDLYDIELFPDWRRVERPALADGAKPRLEVLWMNFSADGLFGA